MGFWSGLAKIGATVAAPFTGGASLALNPFIDAMSGIGQVSGAAGAAASSGRESEAAFNLKRDQMLMDAHQQDLQNRATLPKTFAKQAASGDVMANYNSGDYLKNLFGSKNLSDLMGVYSAAPRGYTGTTAAQAQQELSRQAMNNLLKPPTAPTPSAYPKASWGEKALGGISLGTSLLGALGGTLAKKPPIKTGS